MAAGKEVRQKRSGTATTRASMAVTTVGSGNGPALLRTAAQERALRRAAFQIFAQTDEKALLQVALDAVSSLLQVDVIALFLASNDGATLRCRAIRRQNIVQQPTNGSLSEDTLASEVLHKQVPRRTRSWSPPEGKPCASALAVPFSAQGDTRGVLIVGRHTASRFRNDHVALLSALGQDLALALRRLRMPLEFISKASHEIRTPLTALQGFTELMLSREVSPSVQREWLGLMNQEAVRLGELIEEMLDVTRIESGQVRLTLTPVRLGDVIARVAQLLNGDGHRVHLLAEEAPSVMADGNKLTQVITNLLRNALDYSQPKLPVEVEVASRCLADGEATTVIDGASPIAAVHHCRPAVSVAIRDRGIGMTAEDLRQAFLPFHRSEASRELAPGGSGLGLAIAKAIVERHQGRLWAHSRLGQGSTFGFCLPAETNGAS